MKQLKIPKRLDQLSIEKYKRVIALNEIEDEQERAEKLISYLANIPVSEVRNLKVSSFEKMGRAIGQMQPLEKTYPLEKFIEVDGQEYGFHPNLSEMTVGEFADLDRFCQESVNNLETIMSILYRPVTKKSGMFYSIAAYEGINPKPFAQVPVSVAMGAMAFFLSLGTALLKSTNNSFKVEVPPPSLQKSGGGTPPSTT